MSVDQIVALAQQVRMLRRVVLGLCLALAVVAGVVLGLGVHVLNRQHIADQRNTATKVNAQHDRDAICAVLLPIPAKHRSPAVRQALAIERCNHLQLPPAVPPHLKVVPTSRPSRQVSAPLPTPRATVTRTARPTPAPTVTRTVRPSRPPSPRPTPSPSPTCLLNNPAIKVCLPNP